MKKVELFRNLIVHNAGKINLDYIKLEPTEHPKLGEYVPLSSDYLEEVSNTLQLIASDIYLQVSKKYFGVDENEAMSWIMSRQP